MYVRYSLYQSDLSYLAKDKQQWTKVEYNGILNCHIPVIRITYDAYSEQFENKE
ncbi:hypothetical protein [Pseudoalteromonas luteoviolacea]|uniref:hypothetical protein n=1 Tax=Pseudoalteromonas luteoviolacea TaxID=43657 RepID=UPI00163D007E|nr:hypothetical protein [Pseudoalteromonas luteoviolacea]